jgi:purine-nucleoside phosphorylase
VSDIDIQINDAAGYIRRRWSVRPRVGIILGTGLATFADQIEREAVFPYDEIPHFPAATALGHSGQLVCGKVAGVSVATMDGRFHLYEGYPLQQITLPVRVMHELGIELLIVSNASGGLNPYLAVGDILIIEDHLNLMFANPLVGPAPPNSFPRMPSLNCPYDPSLIAAARAIARRADFAAHVGVYVSLRGPNYEPRAEYRFLRRIGGDVVGMSTVPEVIVAAQLGLPVLALSVVTNVCRPDALHETDGQSVVDAAGNAEPKMRTIVLGVLAELAVRSNSVGDLAATTNEQPEKPLTARP